jgi:hypothetical protein
MRPFPNYPDQSPICAGAPWLDVIVAVLTSRDFEEPLS